MILLENKKDCCGCAACVQICPKQCIQLMEDNEGFLYPKIDQLACIDCGRCDLVCPVINQSEKRKPIKIYAAKNRDEQIREESSSGGIFTLIAEQVIMEGGCVFGACFDDNWGVVHDCREKIGDLGAFRGSKYLQSEVRDTYNQCKKYLKQSRKVLYSGTPCQIAGLKKFLNKDYSNLLTVDFICHGVPSPKVWQLYKQELLDKYNDIYSQNTSELTNISFRNKTEGWKKFSFIANIKLSTKEDVIFRETLDNNIYMKGFLRDLYLRPSCYECPSRNFKSDSDITIADFWGVENELKEFDDDKGVSLLMINTLKGESELSKLDSNIQLILSSYEQALRGNPSMENNPSMHKKRDSFFADLEKKKLSELIKDNINPTFKEKIFLLKRRIRNKFLYLWKVRK